MNLYNSFTNKEIQLLNNAGITIENKDYAEEEMNRYAIQVGEYIMSQSSKNQNIGKVTQEYGRILDLLGKSK